MSSLESGLPLPQPNALAGRLWTVGDPGVGGEMTASAVARLDLVNAGSTEIKLFFRVAGRGALGSAVLGRLEDLLLPQHRDQLADHAIRLLDGAVSPECPAVKL